MCWEKFARCSSGYCRYLLWVCFAVVVGGCLMMPQQVEADVVGEMNFLQIEPVEFSLDYDDYISATSRLWYAHFQADDAYESKPLFVLLNGGPGCGTCMNLFSMNTAPYTLDRNRMSTNDPYMTNAYSWTALGNLLYIDAPNTGYSYTLDADPFSWHLTHLWEFIGGDNYNAFIDAAQVLRGILQFLDAHPTLKTNEVIMVGESYSGVRVSTLLNLLLYHNTYAAGAQTYQDPGLITAITNHFKTILGKEPPFSPEDVATQFGRQILIQPQIVDKYQGADMYASFEQPGSTMERLGYDARATTNWPDYLNNNYGGTCTYSAVSGYLSLIDRDAYNALEYAEWTDDNEYFSMKRLNSCSAMETITGGCNPTNIPYMAPAARSNAVKFMIGQSVFDNAIVKWLVNQFASEAQINMLETMAPGWKTGREDMDYDPEYLVYKLGELNDIDAYVTGTNPYIFLGFMSNGGGDYLPEVAYNWYYDPFDISPGDSDRYGRMFLENLAIVDTFMTDAKYDYVVYAPTLPSQFAGNRFTNYVEQITICQGDATRRYGSFTVDYKDNAVRELQESPEYRTVSWRYYGESGHAVSASQPGEFREDVASWMNNNWYNVYPREGSVTGFTQVTVYGENLCADSNDLQYVTVGGLTATVVSVSSGRITFLTPVLPQGAGDVVLVSDEYGTTTVSNGFCAKLPQTITVQSPTESACYGIGEFISCTATSSAGLDVTFAVDTTDPVDGLTNGATGFSMPAAGTATLRFEQAGDDNWFAAETVLRHIAVTSDTPKVYYVTTDGDNAHHGLTWSQAKRTPQGAADQAVSGDIILVSNGVYNISESVHYGTNRVVLAEGVTMRSVNGPEVTVIDGGGQKRGVYMKTDTTLEGFTIQNGALNGAPTNWPDRAGAGIFASQGATIDHCIIQSNAINISDLYYAIGGGICMDSDVTMSHCRVLDNSVATVGNNSFGGGLAVIDNATNCLIANTVIAGNQTLYYAGGILLGYNSQSTFLNCTITDNSAPDHGSGIYADGIHSAINNSIIYGNTGAADMSFLESIVWFTNSCVPSTSSGHFVNAITNNPQLQSSPRGMIGADSPCRDAGANALTNSMTDAGYRPRVVNDVVDIGAYEFQRWIIMNAEGDLIYPDELPSVTNGTDFGSVPFGVPVTNELFIQNISEEEVSVSIVLRGDAFNSFELEAPAQLTLTPGSITNIPAAFLATPEGTSTVDLCFTDFDLTSFVSLKGVANGQSTASTPESLSFECDYNYLAPEPQTFSLTNMGPSDCTWTVEHSADWMHILPEAIEIAATNALTNLVAYVVPGDLPVGTYVSTNLFVSPSAHTVTQLVTLTISRTAATIIMDEEQQAQYDGTGKAVTATTVPPDLAVTATYNGTTNLPVDVGSYTVTATVDTVNYYAEETAVLTIEKGIQTINFNQGGVINARFGIDLSADASSGLPITYSIRDMVPSNSVNVATIYNGYQLRFQVEASWVELNIVASQAGDDNWMPQAATNAFYVSDSQDFSSWAEESISDSSQRGITNCPAGDGIPNLLKYALGLNPEQAYSQDAVYTYQLSTNQLGETCLVMNYYLSTKTENLEVDPVKTESLLAPEWNTDGIVSTNAVVFEDYEFWKAYLSTVFTNHAAMRLKVRMTD